MKFLINAARFIVGILFIFSGLVKANDPLGLSYKMQEFFELWHLDFLNGYTLAFSVLMIAFEIIAGVAILVGWKMNLFSWLLLLLIIFFTFLTGYAVITGTPKECGCFGNCIPLTAKQSFYKDLILLALILFLFVVRNRIKPALSTLPNVVILFFSAVLSLSLMWYVLQYLPVVDCLPYQKGKSILTEMKIPKGAIPDSTVITFVYEKKGQKVEFTADKFPDDFNDSLYQYKDRYDKLVRKGNAEPPIKDFILTDASGKSVTDSVLNAPGYKFLLFVRPGFEKGDWRGFVNVIHEWGVRQQISPIIVTSISGQADYPKGFTVYSCDATAIKTAARSNPTLYLLNGDVIVNKWGRADFPSVIKYLSDKK